MAVPILTVKLTFDEDNDLEIPELDLGDRAYLFISLLAARAIKC